MLKRVKYAMILGETSWNNWNLGSLNQIFILPGYSYDCVKKICKIINIRGLVIAIRFCETCFGGIYLRIALRAIKQ